MNMTINAKRRYAVLCLLFILFLLVVYSCLHASYVNAQGLKREFSPNSSEDFLRS
jgi:hypothetical protein